MSLENTNITNLERLVTPLEFKQQFPVTDAITTHVERSRQTIRDILDRKDNRLFVVVGPCSVHDTKAALEYAERLKRLSDEVQDQLFILMRVYFEKPRTTVGWKGLINDPYLDGSFQIEKGMSIGRELMIKINEIGLPIANEALDPISPQYMQDLISWSAIGARTTESQTHREMASGLSVPIGFKNGTDGSLGVAINALQSVSSGHSFLGIDPQGKVSIVHSSGNQYAHIVLRGGGGKQNYDSVNVRLTERELRDKALPVNIMVDCSHANSNKDPELQPLVLENITQQILEGNQSIIGVMLESHLNPGSQKLTDDKSALEYGVSITDGCIGWDTTESCLKEMASKLRQLKQSVSQNYV
ncbi:phospho-2-dehydro-3-deoxyheptonate aldolase [Arenicella chitinivorans]|uniref:Phospho-2-dehydro-3-deoxyheptonate aldolase n=1 Tax=Arenicella chitinivorans TaxID=1329800 RepID=A0A918RZJ3_9GAMM|nr:3-deoxy-7-phosphoheptulonate synthase [Arenicella chitinivorans]GHA15374.1 phospho-2-dehydro-3-deoxyheptonate aldolase [Arenicella chitinivorans]